MEHTVIIGSGPAGLTAGIYLARAGRRPLVIEGMEQGGQLMTTNHVDNYPGIDATTGPAIVQAMRSQAERLGVRFVMDEIVAVRLPENDRPLTAAGMIGEYETANLLVATGASVMKTGLPGEAKYWGRGISACLACDAAFYRGKRVAVIGEGPAANAAKNYLEKVGDIVAAIIPPAQVREFEGDGKRLQAVGGIAVDGAFLVTRRIPQTGFLKGVVALDENGYVITTDRVRTSVVNIFAAGDCAQPRFRQAIIAAGDGAYAAMTITAQ